MTPEKETTILVAHGEGNWVLGAGDWERESHWLIF